MPVILHTLPRLGQARLVALAHTAKGKTDCTALHERGDPRRGGRPGRARTRQWNAGEPEATGPEGGGMAARGRMGEGGRHGEKLNTCWTVLRAWA